MPELPEVETTVRGLNQSLPGRTIVSAWMDPRKPVNVGSNMPWHAMRRGLAGRTITRVTRRAKFIVISLDDGQSLWVHQKMTGHLLVGTDPSDSHGASSIRARFVLDDGRLVVLCDTRRFARMILVPSVVDIPKIREIARLGPEPLTLSVQKFSALFASRRGMIKPALMDPSFVAGIGNIYADEILHKAAVHPFSRIEHLQPSDITRVYHAMRAILASAIRVGGSSTDDYRAPDGAYGQYQDRHLAYQRTGQPCRVCRGSTIQRAFRNGRSSHFCPSHQPLLS